jgi:hypothetical protein
VARNQLPLCSCCHIRKPIDGDAARGAEQLLGGGAREHPGIDTAELGGEAARTGDARSRVQVEPALARRRGHDVAPRRADNVLQWSQQLSIGTTS